MARFVVLIGHGENTWDVRHSKGISDDPTTSEKGDAWEEFWFNEAVGKIVVERLRELGHDVLVPQMWDADDIGLQKRVDMANAFNPDFIISIHANAGPEGIEGACIFYWYTSAAGEKFANMWIENFKEFCPEQGLHGSGKHESKPNHWTNFKVIRETNAPAALIEHGFFTTPSQLINLKKPDFQRRAAEALIKTAVEFVGEKYEPVQKEEGSTVSKNEVEHSKPKSKYDLEFEKAIKRGLTDGTNPDAPATRKQAAVMTSRAIDYILDALKEVK